MWIEHTSLPLLLGIYLGYVRSDGCDDDMVEKAATPARTPFEAGQKGQNDDTFRVRSPPAGARISIVQPSAYSTPIVLLFLA